MKLKLEITGANRTEEELRILVVLGYWVGPIFEFGP